MSELRSYINRLSTFRSYFYSNVTVATISATVDLAMIAAGDFHPTSVFWLRFLHMYSKFQPCILSLPIVVAKDIQTLP